MLRQNGLLWKYNRLKDHAVNSKSFNHYVNTIIVSARKFEIYHSSTKFGNYESGSGNDIRTKFSKILSDGFVSLNRPFCRFRFQWQSNYELLPRIVWKYMHNFTTLSKSCVVTLLPSDYPFYVFTSENIYYFILSLDKTNWNTIIPTD